ncbi:MAG: hypothetical protein HOP04_07925 [Methylophilaceae bacterium]|nr:hypothetical protein [Methylophilaceae bacterium]
MRFCPHRSPLFLLLFFLLAFSSAANAVSAIHVQVGAINSPGFTANKLALDFALPAQPSHPQLNFQTQLVWHDKTAAKENSRMALQLSCAAITNPQVGNWRCERGLLNAERIKAPFSLSFTTKNLNGQPQISAELSLLDVNFSDAEGLHAGEKVAAKLSLNAFQQSRIWHWQSLLDWQAGEVFWQPFYFATGGHQFKANGQLDVLSAQPSLTLDNAELQLKDVGAIQGNARVSLSDNTLQTLNINADNLQLAPLYPLLLKPLLDKTMLNNLEMAGRANFKATLHNGKPSAFELDLQGADVEDKNGRFALYKINASIPWAYDESRTIKASYQGGHLLRLPLGAANLSAELNRYALTALSLKLPILDGALDLSEVSAAWIDQQWHWHLRANLSPIAMSDFSQALAWPRMEGKVAASIPLVTYSAGQLSTDGDVQFQVFNGDITISKLAMQTPLGLAPRLSANMQMRHLDLGDLTRTFSFGAIEGKLDGDVNNLQLVNWKPTRFDAVFKSSDGSYPKKISQRAVENISSLGGAGAAAAVQRSFLRFFKQFNYAKLGLSCQLRNDICAMDGIESTPQGYVIVKGSGVPAITVLGYNRNVGWAELLTRIERITDSNAKPVIK